MVVVSILGATGKTGGWVLDQCLKKGYTTKVLVRTPEKLTDAFAGHANISEIVRGDATDESDVSKLLGANTDVVVSTLGSSSSQHVIVTQAAEALVRALGSLQQSSNTTTTDSRPIRVIWMTSVGVNEAIPQGKSYGCTDNFLPSCTCCCGYGCFGLLIFKLLIPCIIGQELWDDMGTSEDVLRNDPGVCGRTVIVRPTNMSPPSEHATFSDKWKAEGGDNLSYIFHHATDPPPNKWINRKAIAAALLDLVEDPSYDGTAVSLFQGPSI